jgi:hypothetical protein
MTTNTQLQVESRFVELMTELFQMDEAQALDFGIYRVIRRHNREVQAFLGQVITDKSGKRLEGGTLSELLENAFTASGHEEQAEDKFRLKDIEEQLGLKPGMTHEQKEAALAQAEGFPAIKGLVSEYRSRIESRASQQTVQQDRTEVLNRLYQFFSRHYQDGDFIVERRYGKGGARYVKSTGEDTEFHWATEDMYYIKSGDIFTDFPVRLANGQQILFTVDPESLQATRAALKPNDKAHYELDAATKDGEIIKVRLKYLKGAQTEKQKDEIVTAVQKVGAGGTAESGADIRRWLGRFMARNQSDFFIHKRLKEALSEDLDIYLKAEVLDVDQLLAGANQQTDLPKRVMKVARIVREVGGHIINFLAALEDFQKALWEKKKLVFETRYVITLDRLERYAPAWLAQNIDTIVKKQRAEWKDLGLGDYAKAADCIRKTKGDLATAATEQYLPLPIDTKNFDAEFKWSMLEAVTAATPLEDALDGMAIQSDNWQALNTLQDKYRDRARSIYIDPPYNTDAGPIDYKNGYRSASWMALMDDRLKLGRRLMRDDGVLCCTIDDYEQKPLGMLLERVFGENSIAGVVSIRINPSGRPKPSGFAVSHEYGFFVQNSPDSSLDRLDRTAAQMKRYKESDEDGSYMWELFRKRGSNSERGARRTLYYPLFVSEAGIRVPHMTWDESTRSWVAQEDPKSGETLVYPIDDNQIERRWRYKHDDVNKKPNNFRATKDETGTWTVYYKYRPANSGVLPTTMWIDSKFSATEHGTGVLKKLFKQHDAFSYPKSVYAVEESLKVSGATEDDALVIDFFAGSGTTAHAVLQMNATSDTNTRFLVVEVNKYFEAVTLPRIKKISASLDWDGGAAQKITGPGAFVRVQSLEQYDDTLESLDAGINEGESGELLFQDPAFALRYRLDKTSRAMYCGVDHFSSPYGYQLKRAEGGGEARPREVDLVESIPYLLGMDVNRLYRQSPGVVMLGRNRRGQSVAVFFRDCTADDSAQWVAGKLAQHPADRVYTNAPAGLSFEGCEKLEAIESVFATQFGRQ